MVASYILGLAEDHFSMTQYFGIYRDDGNVVFEGNRTCEELQSWLHDLQDHVNTITDGDIQFTMDIWKPGEVSRILSGEPGWQPLKHIIISVEIEAAPEGKGSRRRPSQQVPDELGCPSRRRKRSPRPGQDCGIR